MKETDNIYKKNLLVPALKLLSDVVALALAVLFSYYLRFYSPLTQLIPVTKGFPPFDNYLYFMAVYLLVMVFLFSSFNAYRSRFFTSFTQDLNTVLKVNFLGIVFAMSGAFLYRDFSYSRLVFLLIFVNSNLLLLMSRFVFHRIKYRFLEKGFNVIKVNLVGSPSTLRQIYPRLVKDKNLNFQVHGYFADQEIPTIAAPHLGTVEDLTSVPGNAEKPDGLIVSFDDQSHHRIAAVMDAVEGMNIELFYVPDILDILTARFHSLEIEGIPLLHLKAALLSGWQGFLKRGFDLLVSSVALLLLSPLFILLAILVKLSSPGPVFYLQRRIGLDGREFSMIKFRSMRSDAEAASGPVWSVKDDPRTTPIGKLLRRSSLDELPQLMNVWKGEMSLVGPRPERRHFVEQFQTYVPRYVERHRVRSGMTGWAQVNGMRGQSSIEDRTRYDLYYIENWSLWFDIKIILMTVVAVVRGDNAY